MSCWYWKEITDADHRRKCPSGQAGRQRLRGRGQAGEHEAVDRREETMDSTEGCQMRSRGEGRETKRKQSRERGSRQIRE